MSDAIKVNKMQHRAVLVCWMLVVVGAEVGAESRAPALVEAAQGNRVDLVRALLRAGADPDLSSPGGWTALMAAAADGRKEMAIALLDAGADPDAHDRLGRTPMDIAQKRGQTDMVRLLRSRGAQGSGKSPNDTVCVRRWGGSGFCGTIDRVEGNRFLLRVTRVTGCQEGCADLACSGGERIQGDSLERRIWVRSSCLTETYPGSGRR